MSKLGSDSLLHKCEGGTEIKAFHSNDFFLFFRKIEVLIRNLKGMLIIINLILTLSDFFLMEVRGFILFVFGVCICVYVYCGGHRPMLDVCLCCSLPYF